MKINEKTLIHVANASHLASDHEGYLYKRGEVNRSFQKRWCCLKGNLFYYHTNRGDREPLGCIILEGCRIELAEDEFEMFAFKIAFGAPGGRTYVLGCESQELMESWMKALSCASYDYLKLMVAELQRQLDEISEADKRRTQRAVNASLNPSSARVNPFDNDNFDLIDFGNGDVSVPWSRAQQPVEFTRRPFAEIHDAYSQQFRSYLEEQRRKNQQQDLLLL